MLVALKSFSIGDYETTPGEPIPGEVQKRLPTGYGEKLKAQRYVEEQSDEQAIEQLIADHEHRLAKLERKLNAQPKRRKTKVA